MNVRAKDPTNLIGVGTIYIHVIDKNDAPCTNGPGPGECPPLSYQIVENPNQNDIVCLYLRNLP